MNCSITQCRKANGNLIYHAKIMHIKRKYLPKLIKYLVVFLIVYTCVMIIQYESQWLLTTGMENEEIRTQPSNNGSMCPDVLTEMTKGRWIRNTVVTEFQEGFMKRLVSEARDQYSLPKNMQRADGRCGNVTFKNRLRDNAVLRFFRATCDPEGRTPCCKSGICQSLPTEKCTCTTCFDLRREIHAELATWTAEDARCRLRHFTEVGEVCRLLIGTNLIFAGDSLMRQFYVALVLLVSGNLQNGALRRNITNDERKLCSGMHQFTKKECRKFILYDAILCDGTVSVSFKGCPSTVYVNKMLGVMQSLAHISRSIVLFGLGQHDSFQARLVASNFLLPVLKYRKYARMNWPRLVWTSVHAYSTLAYPDQRNVDNIEDYNKEIGKVLTNWGVPVLDTFNMTRGAISIDGVHFGQGVNFAKAQVLLNYISEQKLLKRCLAIESLATKGQQKFLASLSSLSKEEGFCDVSLELPDGQRKCNRLILAAISPFFKVMLSTDMLEGQSGLVKLPTVSTATFNAILAFYVHRKGGNSRTYS